MDEDMSAAVQRAVVAQSRYRLAVGRVEAARHELSTAEEARRVAREAVEGAMDALEELIGKAVDALPAEAL